MVDLEADDALASAAAVAADDARVEQVIICTPDKDLGQCVGGKVVQLDRRSARSCSTPTACTTKFGVPPESIPDWLALVGDRADGFPGPAGVRRQDRGRGARRATGTSKRSPTTAADWDVPACAASTDWRRRSRPGRDVADRFKELATLRTDADVGTVDDWEWTGPVRRSRRMVRAVRVAETARHARREAGAEATEPMRE